MFDHEHKFDNYGDGWACTNWPGSCGLIAPACFSPKPTAMLHPDDSEAFIAEHFMIVSVP